MYEFELTYEIDGKRNHIDIVHVKKHHLTKACEDWTREG
jgi:hypothetical protein